MDEEAVTVLNLVNILIVLNVSTQHICFSSLENNSMDVGD